MASNINQVTSSQNHLALTNQSRAVSTQSSNQTLANTNTQPAFTTPNATVDTLINQVIMLLLLQIQQMMQDQSSGNGCGCDTQAAPTPSPSPVATPASTPAPASSSSAAPADPSITNGISSITPFTTPVGATEPAPIRPGESVEVEFTAQPGENISFASMYAPTNDYFFAPSDTGIPVYDESGNPISGDVSHMLGMWDAGTEADEKPFEGEFQTMGREAERIAEPNTGPDDPNDAVRRVDGAWGLPQPDELMKAEIIHNGGDSFTFRLTNVSDQTKDASPNSPGALIVHDNDVKPIFENGKADRGWGLEGIAEDGSPEAMMAFYREMLGLEAPAGEATGH